MLVARMFGALCERMCGFSDSGISDLICAMQGIIHRDVKVRPTWHKHI